MPFVTLFLLPCSFVFCYFFFCTFPYILPNITPPSVLTVLCYGVFIKSWDVSDFHDFVYSVPSSWLLPTRPTPLNHHLIHLPSLGLLPAHMCLRAKSLQSCLILCDSGPWPSRLLCPWDSPGKNAGVGCHALLQGIFPIQDQARSSYVSCIGRWILYH